MAGIPTELLELRQLSPTSCPHHSGSAAPAKRCPCSLQPETRSLRSPQRRKSAGLPVARGPRPASDGARIGLLDAVPTRGYPVSAISAERFGEWLVRRRCIGRSELFNALDVTLRHGCRLGDALVWLEVLDRQVVEREARFFQQLACSPAARMVPKAE